jgi:hypothetical protein
VVWGIQNPMHKLKIAVRRLENQNRKEKLQMTADERYYYDAFIKMKQFGVESLPDFTADLVRNREFTKLNLVVSDAEQAGNE